MNDLDERFAQALRRAAEPSPPPIDSLVAGGIARGERMRRRFVRTVVGGVLTVVVVAGGAVIAVPGALDRNAVVTNGNVDSTADTEADPFSEQTVVDTVLGLMPEGEVSGLRSGSNSDLRVWFEFVFDDGAGPGLIQGTARVVGKDSAFECPLDEPTASETRRTLGDGTELMVATGPHVVPQDGAADSEPERLLSWSVCATRPDGWSINLTEINAPTEHDAERSRPEPPLDPDELVAIVTSERWPRLATEARDKADREEK